MRGSILIYLCLPFGCQNEAARGSLANSPSKPGGTLGPDSGLLDPDSGLLGPDTGESPPGVSIVDCGLIAVATDNWELCFEGDNHCEAIYLDGAGCDAVCAEAGLVCTGAYENHDETCAPDYDRPVLPCDSGHESDYCICGGTGESSVDAPGVGRTERLLLERAGFGRNVTGGDPSRVYTVTSLSDEGPGSLRAALESTDPWTIVFAVDGNIHWGDEVRVLSNKTVDGRGHDISVDGTWRLQDVHNVIISDLSLTRSPRDGEEVCGQDGDVMTIIGDGGPSPADFSTRDIWLHHLDFRDGGDGLLDIRGGTQITISWSHFVQHKKVTLAWQDVDGRSTEGMYVTWHHNHFDHTTVRNPRFHYGRAHFVNNYVEEWWQSGVASYDGAQFFSEANIYQAADDCFGIPGVMPCVDENPCAVNNDWYVDRGLAVTTTGTSDEGWVKSTADLLINGARIEVNRPSAVFDPAESYTFTAEVATESLAVAIATEVGPRTDWVE
jgi:pectate lyase